MTDASNAAYAHPRRLAFQGSRWEFGPSYLEVAPGPWGGFADFGTDVVGSWKAAIDWHADRGLNLMIAGIPYSRTDRIYLGWPYHYILGLESYPHHEDLFSDDFRARNLDTLNAIFAYGAARGILMLVHHFNYFAPRRMAAAMGWCPRYPTDEADWIDGDRGVNPSMLLVHNCCWNVAGYQAFMRHCWAESSRLLPGLGGFLMTAGEGNRGLFEGQDRGDARAPGSDQAEAWLGHWYASDMRYVRTSAHFIETFCTAMQQAGKKAVVRAWSVEGAPHFMPRGPTYLIKHQLFDCIDAPGDPLVRKWLDCGHTMWVEAMFIGENAGPIQWANAGHYARIGDDILSSGVQGAVTVTKQTDLRTPVNWLAYEQFHAALNDRRRLADRSSWTAPLAASFGAHAETALQAMELISRGVLLISKIAHRIGEGWICPSWATLTPVLQGWLNIGRANGTPPPCWRGDLFTIKEYLDWLEVNPWEEDWMRLARRDRRCPLDALQAAIDDAAEAARLLESIRPPAGPGACQWQELRCSAGLDQAQLAMLLHACRTKILFASCRACLSHAAQMLLARQCLGAIEACERAQADLREWLFQFPPDFGYVRELCAQVGDQYRRAARELQPYRRELTRFLDGHAWTLSRFELMWRAINLDDVASQPAARGDGIPLMKRQVPWPAENDRSAGSDGTDRSPS